MSQEASESVSEFVSESVNEGKGFLKTLKSDSRNMSIELV